MAWNERYLSKPRNSTVLYNRKSLEEIVLGTNFNTVSKVKGKKSNETSPEKWLSGLIETLENGNDLCRSTQKNLEYEKGCLFAFIYQNACNKNEKFLQVMKQVGKCLKRWDEIELCEVFSDLLRMIPKEYFYIRSIRLPSSQCMYYLLQRLVGSFHLHLKCISYCLKAAAYFRAKAVRGHFIGTAILGYAIVSRIRALLLDLAASIAKTSDELYPYIMAVIEHEDKNKVEILPHNLKELLDNFMKNNSKELESQDRNSNSKSFIKRKTTKEDKSLSMDLEASVLVGEETEEQEEEKTPKQFKLSTLSVEEEEDVGECVSHSEFASLKKISESIIECRNSVNKKSPKKMKLGMKKEKKKKKRKWTECQEENVAEEDPHTSVEKVQFPSNKNKDLPLKKKSKIRQNGRECNQESNLGKSINSSGKVKKKKKIKKLCNLTKI